MHTNVKVVLLGLSNTGKSSVAAHLRNNNWFVIEVDDIAQYKNKGIWPENENELDILFKEVNQEVLKLENVIYVTSFLEVEDILRFHKAGFTCIELHTSYEELIRRKSKRDGVPKDNYERFKRNYDNYQHKVPTMKKYWSLSLDTTETESAQLAHIVEKFLVDSIGQSHK